MMTLGFILLGICLVRIVLEVHCGWPVPKKRQVFWGFALVSGAALVALSVIVYFCRNFP